MATSEEIFRKVRRRIAEVESGGAKLIPGDEVLARARRLVATCSDDDEDVTEALRRDSEIDADPECSDKSHTVRRRDSAPAQMSLRSGRLKIARRFIAGIATTNQMQSVKRTAGFFWSAAA